MKLGELTGTFTNIDLVNLPAEKLATLIIADRPVSAGPYVTLNCQVRSLVYNGMCH